MTASVIALPSESSTKKLVEYVVVHDGRIQPPTMLLSMMIHLTLSKSSVRDDDKTFNESACIWILNGAIGSVASRIYCCAIGAHDNAHTPAESIPLAGVVVTLYANLIWYLPDSISDCVNPRSCTNVATFPITWFCGGDTRITLLHPPGHIFLIIQSSVVWSEE